MDRFAIERHTMIRDQLERRGVKEKNVLEAMANVPRHLFIPAQERQFAYHDRPLPIGHGQTISQPYVVALMCEALLTGETCKALDVGSGSGYAAAVLAALCRRVISIERIPDLRDQAAANLEAAGIHNVDVVCGDGSLGYSEEAPYDAISVAAGAPAAPEALKRQLKVGGRLVIPVGSTQGLQDLVRITRVSEHDFKTENFGGVAFVPLIGEDAWPDDGSGTR